MELFVQEYLQLVNCVQTILILLCKQNSSDSIKKKIPTNYWLTNHLYNHLPLWKQMSTRSIESHSMCLQIIYNIYTKDFGIR